MEIAELSELDALDHSFGTPSAQKIIQSIVCWDNLSAKQLSQKTGLSESQVHLTLQNLIDSEIIQRESRGNYRLASTKFCQSLKVAYEARIEQVLGKFMYNLSSQLEKRPVEEIEEKLSYMLDRWKPILERNYRNYLASLAEYIIDNY